MLCPRAVRRCPSAAAGNLFETFFLVKERCSSCNFPIHREEGHWLGAIGINTVVTFTPLFLTMLVAFLLTWTTAAARRSSSPPSRSPSSCPSCSSA